MSDKAFLDTNILVFLYSKTEDDRRNIAISAFKDYECFTSTQALNEFSNVCTRKLHLPVEDIKKYLEEIAGATSVMLVDTENILQALELHERYRYSYYDCLMLSSALNSDCTLILTEDMSDSAVIEVESKGKLVIKNIFNRTVGATG